MKKIIIVEDDSLFAESLKQSFRDKDVETIFIDNGSDALKQIEAERPDALLLDIMIVGMSGIEIIDNLKSTNEELLKKTIMMTSMEQKDVLATVLEKGITIYIDKNSKTPEEITDEILNILN